MPRTIPRPVAVTRACGLLAGIAAAVLLIVLAPLGTGVLLAPTTALLGLLVGVAIGETFIRRPIWGSVEPAPAAESASADEASTTAAAAAASPAQSPTVSTPPVVSDGATPHRAPKHRSGFPVPRAILLSALGAVVVLAVLLIVSTATASTDSARLGGRALQRVCSANQSATATPWPGSYYSVPLAIVVLAAIVVAVVGIWLAVRRPRGATIEEEPTPTRLQQRSAKAVGQGLIAVVTAAIGSCALTMGTVLVNIGCAGTGIRIVGWVLLVLAVAAMLYALKQLGTLLLGPTRQPRHGGI